MNWLLKFIMFFLRNLIIRKANLERDDTLSKLLGDSGIKRL